MPDDSPTPETDASEGYDVHAIDRARAAIHAIPEQIGPYRILEQIGSGGMGEVYVGDQTKPIRRRVAIKLIKTGMDTRQVIARFEAERDALAMMDHPNIARVIDAGSTDTGRPYFVMELVRGLPITQFCDDHKLTIRERIEVFVPVCQAVQHAHQKGIIHRDIKPTNVLVAMQDGKPVAKVIDFGIAKAIARGFAAETAYTNFGHMVGTPAYMSPEQAEMTGLDIDTRSDIYSLGVLAYELLTGSTPFDTQRLIEAGLLEIGRIIKEEDPPRPSDRLSTLGERLPSVAARHGTEPGRLGKLVSGELDWIVMRAMEKDRRRRYATANGMAEDLQRHLNGEPIVAAPPTWTYWLSKFARRHRAKLVAALLALALLVSASVVSTTWALRARRAEALATRDRDEAERQKVVAQEQRALAVDRERESAAIVAFLSNDVLGNAVPTRMPDPVLRGEIVVNMIDPAARSARRRFADRPLIQATIFHQLGDIYSLIGHPKKAGPFYNDAFEIRSRLLGGDNPDTLVSSIRYAQQLNNLGRYAEAEPIVADLLERRRRVWGEVAVTTIAAIADYSESLYLNGRYDEALRLSREAVEKATQYLDENSVIYMAALEIHATLLEASGRCAEALPFYERALNSKRRVYGEMGQRTLEAIANYGAILAETGRVDEALPLVRRAADGYDKLMGPDHLSTLWAAGRCADVLRDHGEPAEAELRYKTAIGHARASLGDDHPQTLTLVHGYDRLLHKLGRDAEAEPAERDVLSRQRRVLGPDHPRTRASADTYAQILDALGRSPDAESLRSTFPRTATTATTR